MSVAEILEQIKALSPTERKELVKQAIDLLDAPQVLAENKTDEHWGQSLVRLLNELEPIELIHPEIEDPVEWVKQIRRDQEIHRGLDWGEDE
jgi:hypothetical protein